MRIPGLGGEVMSRLGVNVQVLQGGEIYLALNRGAIDVTKWVGPYADAKLGLNKAAQFYYYPGWWEPGSTFEVQVNKAQWEKLPSIYMKKMPVKMPVLKKFMIYGKQFRQQVIQWNQINELSFADFVASTDTAKER